MADSTELAAIQAENARLIALLETHGIEWRLPWPVAVVAQEPEPSRLQQYAGRLHREHATKTDVRIVDFADAGHPALLKMWEKRQRGYRAMGYRIASSIT
jgi:hypothetical protein